MATGTSREIDELFQLPLGEFTAARNALAKRAGKDGAAIKALSKPPLAAWAVNQLYWQARDRYDDLVRAATDMRRAHKSVIEGKRADLRTAGREHEIAIEAAVKATLAILEGSGQPVTEATRQAIISTVRALPSDETPGRLTGVLSPGGFEMLAGITAAPRAEGRKAPAASGRRTAAAGGKTPAASAERETARAREQKAAAERALRDADQRARQAEFEAARARREATQAERRLEQARQAFDEAQAALEEAEQQVERAHTASKAADGRSEKARSALETARAALLP
jgi:hypothetical protein